MALGTVNVPPKPKHTHTSEEITDFTEQVNTLAAEQVAANAPAAHTQAASTITAGTFAGAVVATDDTAYTTYKVRNSALLSAKPSSIVNGRLAHVYS